MIKARRERREGESGFSSEPPEFVTQMRSFLLVEKRSSYRVFANLAAGFEQLSAWLQQEQIEQVHACLEATGSYSDAIALYLFERGHTGSRAQSCCPGQLPEKSEYPEQNR